MSIKLDESDKQAIKDIKEQAKASTMPTGTDVEVEEQDVKQDELLTTEGKKISDVTTVATPTDVTAAAQTTPQKFDAATYTADSDAASRTGKADAAKGVLSASAVMEAAQGTVSPDALATAATQELDPRATTRYQLAELFKGIEEGGPPPAWAAPAVRKVTAVMQQRGLGASSMAAAATMQAMMESGIPIAAQDAQKYATIQLQNLNNEQQAALQNAAALLQMDTANLNNRQQAALNNAKAFLTMDMQNLTNEQQSDTLTYQSRVQALLSDQAAVNASKQFNAKSQNEIETFFAELGAGIESANIQRSVASQQFNVNKDLAVQQFNAQMEAQQDQFNANMQTQIDQSNATWRRSVNTRNTAAQNEANRQNALNLLGIQQNALNQLWQKYRDKAAWSQKISENALDRAHNAAMQAAAFSQNASLYKTEYKNYLFTTAIDRIWGPPTN